MRKKKGLVITLVIGMIICAVCVAYIGFNFDELGEHYTLEDYELKEYVADVTDFSKLSIWVESTDVEVVTSDTNKIKITYYNMDKDYYTVSTVDGEIKITYTNELGTGFFGYSIPAKKVTVELPKSVSLIMDYNLKYGNATFSGVNTDKGINIDADSVNIKIQNGNSDEINISMKYGELKMESVQSGAIKCNTNSVAINFIGLDGNNIDITAKYGSVTGSFVGSSNDYTVTGNAKDGNGNLSNFTGSGNKTVNIQGDSADIKIEFLE